MLATIARRPLRVRWHLVALVLVAVVPLLIFTFVVVRRHLDDQREILESGMRATARALSVAADREVRTSFAILETLAASPALEADDFKAFHDLCVRTVANRKDAWIVLFARSGQQVVNSSRPFGSPLPNPFRETRPPAADPRYPLPASRRRRPGQEGPGHGSTSCVRPLCRAGLAPTDYRYSDPSDAGWHRRLCPGDVSRS